MSLSLDAAASAPDSLGAPVVDPAFFDEGTARDGLARPSWKVFLDSLDRLGRDEQGARAESSQRILAEHGVTCFVSRPEGGADEAWQLDLLPLLLGAAEWRELERGLRQRARLLNLLLQDLYSTQRLVRDGLVPAPLVFANPGYLRSCQAINVPGKAYLQVYAADLARSPDGRWWVVADRTQAPAGLGFVVENRSVISRVLPEAFRDVQPRPVADALRIWRTALCRCAPRPADQPSVVLLTPGPRNEAYFEHAYLARLLGLTLVEGDDLTVRDRRLFIKTLEGLRGADVVLRRVTDAFCDPLELRGDSLLGVPGLVEAARAGQVSLGNALGSGLLESPAFLPFLPGLCRHLLDEELRLPSVATWWCGEAREQGQVRDRLDSLVVRPALSLAGPPVHPSRLGASQRTELLEQLRHRPHEFVGQEQVRLSQVPIWAGGARVTRPCVLRVFVLHDGQDFTVVPGGLARVVTEDHWSSMALPLSGLNKDVWVLPDGKPAETNLQEVAAVQPAMERTLSDLPSRTADNFFWLGRYTERLEQIVRVARCAIRCLVDDPDGAHQTRIGPLERMLHRLGLVSGPAVGGSAGEALQREILLLLFQEQHASGVRDLLNRIHLAAFSVRDRVSADMWRLVNRLGPDARQRPGRLPLVQASATLHTLVLDLAAFNGMEMENMTRGHGWAFLDLGRRIERGAFVARLLEAVLRSGADLGLLLEPTLEIADSVMTHRRRYFSEPRLASTMELLLQDPTNPRSLAFQIVSLVKHAVVLPTAANPEGVEAVQRCVTQLEARLVEVSAALASGTALDEVPVRADALADFAARLEALSELMTQVFFSHVTPRVS